MKADWNLVELRRVLYQDKESAVSVQPDQEYPMVGVYSFGRGLFAKDSQLGMNTSYKVFYLLKENHIVMSQLFGWEGALALSSKEFEGKYVSNQFPTFLVDETKADRQFIGFYLKRRMVWEMLFERGKGMGSRRRTLKPESLLGLEIPLPPLSEQRRISERLQGLQGKIEVVRRLRGEQVKAVDAIAENLIGEVFERNKQYKKHFLKDLASKIGSGSTPKGGRSAYPESGIPFIRSLNVRMRKFQYEGIVFIDQETHAAMKGTQIQPNDVLLNITGASIGRVACVPSDLKEANINQHTCIVRPKPEILDYEFLMFWLSQPNVQAIINDEQKGATRQGFTKRQIENFEIPMPPISVQREIVAEILAIQSKTDTLKAAQDAQLLELEGLFPGVLEEVFGGGKDKKF
ncbi:MAG: restriction endonuclease subunit S [Saprospiraceae bacterium]